jgi:hypothetical protein
MKSIWSALLVLVVVTGSAAAQPGQTPPDPYPAPPPQPYPEPPPQPQPPPPPNGYSVPPPYAYQPQQIQLTAEDAELLQRGEISDGQHLGGGVVAIMFGFGIGQAIQGRWSDTGWIFTLGETASIVALVAGAVKSLDNCPLLENQCTNNNNDGEGLLIAGVVGIVVFRTWEVVDAFMGPVKHNARVRDLRMRLGIPQPMYGKRITPYMNKSRDGGGVAGLQISF